MLKAIPPSNADAPCDQDRSTLRSLFESEEPKLLRYAFSLTGRKEVAEEIVQEVFLQLHARWGEVNEPLAWLVRSVRNQAFHHLRKSRRETVPGEDALMNVGGVLDDSPDAIVSRMEAVSEIRQLLNQLPEKDRKLIQLKYFDGLKYRDISERTGLTISNVGFRLNQVLKKLAIGLLPKGIEKES